jgi:hypothetical protein
MAAAAAAACLTGQGDIASQTVDSSFASGLKGWLELRLDVCNLIDSDLTAAAAKQHGDAM